MYMPRAAGNGSSINPPMKIMESRQIVDMAAAKPSRFPGSGMLQRYLYSDAIRDVLLRLRNSLKSLKLSEFISLIAELHEKTICLSSSL